MFRCVQYLFSVFVHCLTSDRSPFVHPTLPHLEFSPFVNFLDPVSLTFRVPLTKTEYIYVEKLRDREDTNSSDRSIPDPHSKSSDFHTFLYQSLNLLETQVRKDQKLSESELFTPARTGRTPTTLSVPVPGVPFFWLP